MSGSRAAAYLSMNRRCDICGDRIRVGLDYRRNKCTKPACVKKRREALWIKKHPEEVAEAQYRRAVIERRAQELLDGQ